MLPRSMPTTFCSLPREIRQEIIYLALEETVHSLEVRDLKIKLFGSDYKAFQCACAETGQGIVIFACFFLGMSNCPAVRKHEQQTKLWFRGVQKRSAVVVQDLRGAFTVWQRVLSRSFGEDKVLKMRNRMMLEVLADCDMWKVGYFSD